jgi:phage shock protein A
MEEKDDDLSGMDTQSAKEYVLSYITTFKLTRKKMEELGEELSAWNARSDLARSKGEDALALQAESEADRIRNRQAELSGEAAALQSSIEKMLRQLPDINRQASMVPTVDPVLLEQELLMALSTDEETAKTERALQELERNTAAEAELARLKERMGKQTEDKG